VWDWSYSCTRSQPRHYVEVSGWFHALVGWAPELAWMFWRRESSSASQWNEITTAQFPIQQSSHYQPCCPSFNLVMTFWENKTGTHRFNDIILHGCSTEFDIKIASYYLLTWGVQNISQYRHHMESCRYTEKKIV
jgi:hypothetical protein